MQEEGQGHVATAHGRDIYAFTAPLVVEAVERILDGRSRGSDALAPGEAFDSTDFL
jgi:S-adenosylmethionine hydrolase